jgi:hypothetical protein
MKKNLQKLLHLLLWMAMLGFVAPISVVAADCYIAGSFNGWSATATKLTQNGDQYELIQKFDGGTQFKIVYNGNWYGYDAVKDGTDFVTSADGSNKNIQFNLTGCYGLFFKSNESTAAGIFPPNASCFLIFAILFLAILSKRPNFLSCIIAIISSLVVPR